MRLVKILFLVGGLFFGLLLLAAVLLIIIPMDLVVSGAGTIEPLSWRYITPEVRGIVNEVLKHEGDFVEEGEVIARLDASDAAEHLRQAALLFAEAEREEALAIERYAYLKDRRRTAALGLSQFTVEREKAAHRLDGAKAARRRAEAAVLKAEQTVAAARIRLVMASQEHSDQERLAAAGLVSERLVERAQSAEQLARIAVDAMMNDLAAAREELDEKKAAEALMKAELDGLSELHLSAALETAGFELKRGEVLLEQARARQERLSSERDRLAHQVELHNVRAPMTGRIEKLYFFTGEMSGTDAEGNVSQVAGMVVGDKSYYFMVSVPPLDVVEVREGQKVEVRMAAYRYRRYGSFRGEVADVDRASGDGYFRAKVRLDESIYPLRAGMKGYGRIKVSRTSVLSYILGLAESKEIEELRHKADELGSATRPSPEATEESEVGAPAQGDSE